MLVEGVSIGSGEGLILRVEGQQMESLTRMEWWWWWLLLASWITAWLHTAISVPMLKIQDKVREDKESKPC